MGRCERSLPLPPRPAPNAGNTVEAPGEGGCPPGMIAVGTFCVDRYEATLVRVDTGEAWCPYDNPGMIPMRAKTSFEEKGKREAWAPQ